MAKQHVDRVADEFLCAGNGKPLYMPVVTNEGIAYSYLTLYDMFRRAEGPVKCKVTGEHIQTFPNVCLPLHQYLFSRHRGLMRSRRAEDEAALLEKFKVQMPDVPINPDDGDDGFEEAFECVVSGELAYEPCVLSSGTIVSKHCIPEGGFKKDPDRLFACALHGQIPKKSDTVEAAIREMFPKEYSQRAKDAPTARNQVSTKLQATEEDYVHIALGCDGCGMHPIIGNAYEDVDCPDWVCFHVCEACYKLNFHKRVLSGRFNQVHMPDHRMVLVPPNGLV